MHLATSRLIFRADAFADDAHRGQLRAYTGAPYITHPRAVARILAHFTQDEELLAAGLLHDVPEMTAVEVDTISDLFGSGVSRLVDEVTDDSTPAMGNRAMRKAHDANRLGKASAKGKTLKLADILENAGTIGDRDPKFARVWLAEKDLLLPRLVGGHPTLHSITRKVVYGAMRKLAERPLLGPGRPGLVALPSAA